MSKDSKTRAREAAEEINARNRLRNHVLTADNGTTADVMETSEMAGIIERHFVAEFAASAATNAVSGDGTPKRGDPNVGRTVDEERRPLVCFVCAERFAVTFNFCFEHKNEYERLKAQSQAEFERGRLAGREEAAKQPKFIVVDIGCIECGASSELLGVYDSQEDAERSHELGDYFDRAQHCIEVFQFPPEPEAAIRSLAPQPQKETTK